MTDFTAFSLLQHTVKRTLGLSVLFAMGIGSASAMLPTPEPELDAPSNRQNLALVQQATVPTTPVVQRQQATPRAQLNAVRTQVQAFLISIDDQGKEILVPVTADTQLQSGNLIEYQGLFTNTSPDRQRHMTVTMTIPDEVKLYGAIDPEFPKASVDGSRFNRTPLRGRVGNEVQEVPLELYKALRWDIVGLGIDETAVVKYRAVVR
ncbi:hypothetical protein [Psychrobacter sp. I-STPA6b]|uniref:hypothetical protein n=1 Tax=Psychrobacter sp. I-STPA6b TaxID=2585718 RepID=UPI001D0C7A48|nr:hypothetical protein [Psychrobacter sp. I-STPA6b]